MKNSKEAGREMGQDIPLETTSMGMQNLRLEVRRKVADGWYFPKGLYVCVSTKVMYVCECEGVNRISIHHDLYCIHSLVTLITNGSNCLK